MCLCVLVRMCCCICVSVWVSLTRCAAQATAADLRALFGVYGQVRNLFTPRWSHAGSSRTPRVMVYIGHTSCARAQLKRVTIPKNFDGHHRGFGFVEFLTEQVRALLLTAATSAAAGSAAAITTAAAAATIAAHRRPQLQPPTAIAAAA